METVEDILYKNYDRRTILKYLAIIGAGLAGVSISGCIFKNSEPIYEPVYLAQIDAETVLNDKAIIKDLVEGNVNTVVLQVFPDDEQGVYWNSSIAPYKKDILRDFTDKAHENNLRVWAWMTTLDMPWIYENNPEWRIKAYKNGEYTTDTGWYKRISPCVQEHRKYITDLYAELASKYDVDGILLQDDLYWGENESFDDGCKQLFYDEFGAGLNPSVLESELKEEFYDWRAKQLTEIVRGINSSIKKTNPDVKLAVNIYPDSVVGKTDPNYKTHLSYIGQNYTQLAENVDYAVVMAYHRMDRQPVEWVGEVAKQAIRQSSPEKVIIKVQGFDWNINAKIPNSEVKQALNLARKNGAKNTGIYLQDFRIADFGLDFRDV